MAIIGKSADEIKGLLGSADSLAQLIEILSDKKSPLKDRIAELDGIDELLGQKKQILNALSKAEDLSAKNKADLADIAAQKSDIDKMITLLKDAQKEHDDRESDISTKEKTIAKQGKDAEKALANAQNLEAAAKAKNDLLDKLVSENQAKSDQMSAVIAAYKNKLSVLDQVA